MRHIIRRHIISACTLGILAFSFCAQAAYPEKPIRIVVGFPPGQATDIIARLAAKKLEEGLNQPVIVENKPGAAGIIGTMDVVRAKPDGYTLLVGSSGTLSINPSLYGDLAYDPLKDLSPIAELSEVPLFLAVNANVPVNNAKEFVEMVKADPTKYNYGSAGSGVTSHLAMELLKHDLGLEMDHIPYKGSPAAVTDLVGGRVTAMVDTGPALILMAQKGHIKLLAVLSDKRVPAQPDVPTLKEAGLGDVLATAWVGLAAPKGTPDEVLQTLYQSLQNNWQSEDVDKVLNGLGSLSVLNSPEEFTRYIESEIKKWKVAVELSGAKVN